MRVVNKAEESIGFRLNIIGVHVYRDYCQISAKSGDEWFTVGLRRALPVIIPEDPAKLGSDPLVLTAYQYEHEHPGSDLYDLLAQRKDFDRALNESGKYSGAKAK